MAVRPPSLEPTTVAALKQRAHPHAGVFTLDDLSALEIDRRCAKRWADAGWINRHFRGTYSFAGTPWTPETTRWSAVLSCGPSAVLGERDALAELGVVKAAGHPVVLVPDRQRRPQPGLTIRRSRNVRAHERTRGTSGVPITTLARSLLNCAPRAKPALLDQALDRSVQLRLFDRATFERLLSDHPRAAGRPQLILALERLDHNAGRSRSLLELKLIDLVRRSSLPRPAVNYGIGGYQVDLYWHQHRAIVEADGGEFHTSPAQIVADQARQAVLESLGFRVMRFDWNAVVYRPEEVIRRIATFLAETRPARA